MKRSTSLALAILLSLVPASAFAGATTCLTGTAPEVAGDADDLRDARAAVDAACPCSTYDGTDTHERGDYMACLKTAFDLPAVTALRKQCGGTLKKIYKASTCGRAAVLAARPCIYKSVADGKVSCKVRYTNKKDGTPNDKCVSNTKYTATACDGFDFCLDAADTDQNLLIAAPGDDGQCYAPAGETICQDLGTGDCTMSTGTSGLVLEGDVLTPGMIYRGGQVVVDDTGVIVHVGCASTCVGACATLASTASTVTCPDGAISSGLVNAHDHSTFSQNSPYTDSGERYEHRHDWRLGLNGHTEIGPIPGSASGDQLRWNELRGLMAGTTSIVGSGGAAGLMRNLDSSPNQGGLGQVPAHFDTFPLNDSSGTQIASGCAYGVGMAEPADIVGDDAYLPHEAEGVDAFSRNEFTCLSQSPNDVLESKTAVIGGGALSASQMVQMSAEGASLIWSPRSNITLYGDTARVTAMQSLGINIALGTDWIATGSMNMLRELRCADAFDDDYLNHSLSDEDLWLMATRNAAEATGFPSLGSLEAGNAGDISIFAEAGINDGYGAVVRANPESVLLVIRGGVALYGVSPLTATLNGGACDTTTVCGEDRNVCILDEIGKNLTDLTTGAGAVYPLYFCGDPTNEPLCVPKRPASVSGSTIYTGTISGTDADGDGIVDASDNCPNVFNPVRPVDGGVQADSDADGEGDSCDPCPIEADVTVCAFNPNDADSDGVLNASDNCPFLSNPTQADMDADLHGDACDACPTAANPGNAPCPAMTAFGPDAQFVRAGDSDSPTFEQLLTVQMNATVAADTFIPITSSDPSSVVATGGGVTVFAGNSSAEVHLDGLQQSASVTLTATYDSVMLQSTVRVLGAAETPTLISLTPPTASIAPGGVQNLTVTLDIPAPPGGTLVTLTQTPSGSGSMATGVLVAENTTTQSFGYVDGSVNSEIDIDATLGMTTLTSTISIISGSNGAGLVINEVDYDNVGTDNLEFIEIYNPTASAVALPGVSVYLVNGSTGTDYASFDLGSAGSSLGAGQYLVIMNAAVSAPGAAYTMSMTNGLFQNGAPDGVALINTLAGALIDAFSYEGSITNATIASIPNYNLVEGTAEPAQDSNTVQGSLARLPNGSDINDAAADWNFTATPTPGADNVP